MGKLQFTDEQFVVKWKEAYMDDRNQAWVAKELNTTRQAVQCRKGALLRAGVRLPKLVSHHRTNKDELNAILEDILEDKADE